MDDISKLFPLLEPAFTAIPLDWKTYFIQNQGKVEVCVHKSDYCDWVRKEVFFYTSSYALLHLIATNYSTIQYLLNKDLHDFSQQALP